MLGNGKTKTMKKLHLVLVAISLICVSCSSKKTKTIMSYDKIKFVELIDSQLVTNIREYHNKYLNQVDFEYALVLSYDKSDFPNRYELFYEMNLSSLVVAPPLFYSLVDDRVVFIRAKSSEFKFISQKNIDELYKTVFSRQYDYYNRNRILPPPITYSCDKWIFSNNKCIRKVLY